VGSPNMPTVTQPETGKIIPRLRNHELGFNRHATEKVPGDLSKSLWSVSPTSKQ